jgi:hypothetical protein
VGDQVDGCACGGDEVLAAEVEFLRQVGMARP